MNILVPALIGLVLLAGLITLALGNKGWSWGTVVAAILVLLASGGYVYLAARIAERERAWTTVVRKLESDVLRARDATTPAAEGGPQPIPGEKSLAVLADEESRWRRVLERVETWRGRSWSGATFTPPQADGPGTITLPEQEVAAEPAPAEGAEGGPAGGGPSLPLHAGAEVSVFDDAALAEGGRFLGVFRVTAAAFDAAAKRTTLSIVPAAQPDAKDLESWAKPAAAVTVYEDLPVDRWMAFHTVPGPTAPTAGVLPDPTKTDPQELLDKLDRLEANLERHGTEVEGEPAEIAARITAGDDAPGRYWAVVEFTAAHDLDEAVVKRITDLLAPDIDDEDRVRKSFEPGDVAEFDLQTALALESKAKIVKVIDRRPLSDTFTVLFGGSIPGGAGAGVRAEGIATLRRTLQAEIAALDQATQQLAAARENVAGRRVGCETERAELQDDLRQWQADVTAAARTADAFDARLQRLGGDLAATVKAIGTLGRELTAGSERLTEEIDRQAPAAVRGGGLEPAGRTR
jgi:hypothetical protein